MAKNNSSYFLIFAFGIVYMLTNFKHIKTTFKPIKEITPELVAPKVKGFRVEKTRDCLSETFASFVGIQELNGNNRSPIIDYWNNRLNIAKGSPWCASAMTMGFDSCKVKNPRSAWSPAWDISPIGRTIYKRGDNKPTSYVPGMIFTLFYKNLGRVGHVGYVYDISGDVAKTYEGNITNSGTRETNSGKDYFGAYRRDIALIHKIRIYDQEFE